MIWTIKKVYYRTYQKVLKLGMNFMNWKEPELLEGEGSVLKLPALIKEKGLKKILVVTDSGLMKLKLLDPLFNELTKEGISYIVFDKVEPNPTIPSIEECKDLYIKEKCEGIIAFGGGSPMDCAKAATARVVKPRQSVRKMRGYLKIHKKLPPHITSTTGMDALTHAVESYIGKSNVKSTIKYAEDAVILIHANLEKAYSNGKDMEARNNMLKASYYAGNAFTRAFVGYVHAIAHNLGGMYNTPHGLANAVILPYVLEWYGKKIYNRLANLADLIHLSKEGMSEEEKAKAYINEIRRMNKAMNIPEKFDFIKEEDIPTLVARALKEGNPGYPVPKIMNKKDCEQVIRSLMIK